MPLIADPENPVIQPGDWVEILGAGAREMPRYQPNIYFVLSALAELIQPKLVLEERLDGGRKVHVVDKYCYFGAILREGKELGLLTPREYGDIQQFLAREFLA